MINIGVRTEFSFKTAYGFMDKIFEESKEGVCVADLNSTYGHYQLQKISNGRPFMLGVRLKVVRDASIREGRKLPGPEYIFIPKNTDGLEELYNLVRMSYDNFYYAAQLDLEEVENVTDNIMVISDNPLSLDSVDLIGITFNTAPKWRQCDDRPHVAIQDNLYFNIDDKQTYQLLSGGRKSANGYQHNFETNTYPRHILSETEWMVYFDDQDAVDNTYILADMCKVEIPKAPMVKYYGKEKIRDLCLAGAFELECDLGDDVYIDRLDRELATILEKDFIDYFLIVADIIRYSKRKMLVGPARGSSGGSLVCYLLGITTIDPIEHGLIFERFIDLNRADLPDVDIDFPDAARVDAIKYTVKKYGADNVGHIGTVSKMKAKSAIGEFAKELGIPPWETDAVKDSILNRFSGDARAAMRVKDTLETTEVGREFLEKYPEMKIVEKIEGHSRHAGKHAAGIVVSNEPLRKYSGKNSRDGTIMLDKHDAESLNLLKVDFLGLRTLSVLEETAKLAKFDFRDYYKLDLNDDKVFKIFRDMRLCGIFQFEGNAIKGITKSQTKIDKFSDISALSALGRPGPLHSGAATKFIRRRNGLEKTTYICDHPIYLGCTEDTYGVIVYQEQVMNICRNLGKMSWIDVSALRKAMSKSMGETFFNKYKQKFIKGATENGVDEKVALDTWEEMLTFGSWGFNKSHAVGYGMISYWTAWSKAYHPKEFAVASLIHSKNDLSALRLLREFVRDEGFEYQAIDADESEVTWSVSSDGKILGGLTNIDGIATQTARKIIKCRKGEAIWTPALTEKLMFPKTPFDSLFPCQDLWGAYYDSMDFDLSYIEDVEGKHDFIFIGKVIVKDLRDLNDYNEVMKRGGEVYTDNHMFLKLVVEDDSDMIQCRINRYDFERLEGKRLSEELVEHKSWVIIAGRCAEAFSLVTIKSIGILNEDDLIQD